MKKNRLPSEIPASLKGVNVRALLRKRGIYKAQAKNQELKRAALPLARSFIKQKKLPSPQHSVSKAQSRSAQFNPRTDRDMIDRILQVVDTAEKQFHNKVEQFIGHIQKEFLADFDSDMSTNKSLKKFAKKDYFTDNEDNLLVKAELDFAPLLKDVAKISGQEAMNLIGLTQPYLVFDYESTIKRNVEKFTRSMLDTERQSLSDIISGGLQSGKSVPEIRNSIQDAFGNYSKSQAERITRTEVMRASNQATLDSYKQSGVVQGQEWLTYGAIDECAQYNGKIATLDSSFYSSDNPFKDGEPPLHPNCKCVLIPVLENDYPGASLLSDERGFIDIVDDPKSSEFTAYHGEGMNLNNEDIATFGKAFYISKDPSIASMFGDVTKLDIPFGSGSIYTVHTAREYNQLLGDAFLYAKNNGLDTNKAAAIPAYIRSLGYKAAQLAPEAAHAIDEMAGIAIVDLKLIKKLNKLVGHGKAIIVTDKNKERIDYLESLIDKRTKAWKELKEERADDKAYIKKLENYLELPDGSPEED